MAGRRVLFVVNHDLFFVSHRLWLGERLQDAGYEVLVCAGETGSRERIERAGFEFFPLPVERSGTNPRREVRTIAYLTNLYRRVRPDLVHHVTSKPVIYGSAAARVAGVRAVVNAISGLGYGFIRRDKPDLKHRVVGPVMRAGYRLAHAAENVRAIFQNEDDRNRFVDTGVIPLQRTAIVRGSGVDPVRFARRALPDGPPVVLLPARLLWDKGVGEFVEAARALRSDFPGARFVLIGRIDPDNPAAIEEPQVKAWLDEGVVEWWGEWDSDRMHEAYERAHLVVLPSYREGLPLALAEAAMLGRACVTTDVPGCRDTVVHGRTGWLVRARSSHSLAEAMRQALSNRDRLIAFGEAARAYAETRFQRDAVFEGTRSVYQSLGVN